MPKVLGTFDVGVGPEVRAEFEAGLWRNAARSQRRIDGQPAVEAVALDLAASLDDSVSSALDCKHPFLCEVRSLYERELNRAVVTQLLP